MRTPNRRATPALFCLVVGLGLWLGASAAGCSFIFDDSAPEVPLLGDPIPPDSFPKLNVEPARDVIVMTDGDGHPWAAMPAAAPLTLIPSPQQPDTVRLVRLDAAGAEDSRDQKLLSADHINLSYHALYLVDPPAGAAKSDPTQPTRVTVFFPGLSPVARMFTFPSGTELFSIDYSADAVFLYWVRKSPDPRIFITRTDGSFQRALPPPKGYDAETTMSPIRVFFDGTGNRVFVQDGDGRLTVHSTRDETSLDLGVQPAGYSFDGAQNNLLTCTKEGLRRVALDGRGAAVLDSEPCDPDIVRSSGSLIYYKSGSSVRRVAIDGSAPPQVALAGPVGQLLAISAKWGLVYSLDSPITYGAGIGDGWLGGWKFMQRGRRPGFSGDGARLRWLENAARTDTSGDLSSATLSDHAVLHLARNVRTTSELADGRLLAISNAAFKGTQNRLIVIDEATRTARWVVDSARDFLRIPGTQDLLVKIVVGQLGFDIRRVPIPDRVVASP